MVAAREKLRTAPPLPTGKQMRTALVTQAVFAGRPVWTIAPKDRTPTATILYWHGGGYIYPAMEGHWAFFVNMAKRHGWRIIAPLYPLAPEAEVDEVTGFALSFYRDLITRENADRLVMAGDSAGAGLTAATAMLARDAGLPLPAKLILISPWLDAVPDHPDQAQIEPRDAILTLGGIAEAGRMYARNAALTDPRVSPIYGRWEGLPPILAYGGGDDILVTDARALKDKLPEISYIGAAGMIHDWPIFTFPESHAAQAEMAEFSKCGAPQ